MIDHLIDALVKELETYKPGSTDQIMIKEVLNRVEEKLIVNTYLKYNKNKSYTARVLGLSRTTLIYKLKLYGVS